MCKHVAAVLYGVCHRLDQESELLFKLRKVDHLELISKAKLKIPPARSAKARIIKEQNLSEIFGIDISAIKNPGRPSRAIRSSKDLA